jgi:hypothetical protein
MSTQQQAVARSLGIIANQLGITNTSAAARVYEASLGLDPGAILRAIRVSGGVAVSSRSDEQIMDAVQQLQQVNRDAGISDQKAVVHSAMAGGGFEMGGQANRRGAGELKASHDTATAYERQAQSSFSEAQALRNAASVVTREGFSITGDDTYAIHGRAAQEGVSRAAMNDPAVMMDVARRHFLEKYGAGVGAPLNSLDPGGPQPSVDQLAAPTLSDGSVASAEAIGHEASRAQAGVSTVNRRAGVSEQGGPSMHDAAEHFVDTKQRAQAEIEARERSVAEDEQGLRGERSRRYEEKSFFNDANPGGKRGEKPPLTTQR